MSQTCHLCGSDLEAGGGGGGERGDATGWFECADCGELTCADCRSIGVGRSSDHCRRCRG